MNLANIYLVGISLMFVCCTIEVVLCFITITQLCIKKSYIYLRPSFKILTVISMISYTICTICDIIQCITRYKYYLHSDEWTNFESYLASIGDFCYFNGNAVFFVLLLMRIKTSFQVTLPFMWYFSILLTFSIICSIMVSFVDVYFINKSVITMNNYFTKILIPLSISDFMLNSSLFILFIYKIKNKDSMEGIEIAHDIYHDDQVSHESSIDNDKKAILNIMIKHCVLFGIAILSNQYFYVIGIISAVDVSAANFSFGLIGEYTSRAIDNTITITVLWLLLRVNNDKYVRVCKCWHICILKNCMKQNPNIIREGFVVINDNRNTMSVNQVPLLLNGKLEGRDLIVTNNNDNSADCVVKKVEGHNVLITA